jgi:hypothetical protein
MQTIPKEVEIVNSSYSSGFHNQLTHSPPFHEGGISYPNLTNVKELNKPYGYRESGKPNGFNSNQSR